MNLVHDNSFLSNFLPSILLVCCVLAPTNAIGDNWQASIHENGAPDALVGVDKNKRTFNFFEKRSPLSIRYQYPCVTGQLAGDKQQINDLKTPEGIYFVGYKIANGLDFREYGGIAYTLNYPNPVDRLRGKTGHGIWIHSKGFELVPTKGCVAIDLVNINEVGPRLTPGLPVVLAEELKGVTNFDNGTPAQMVSLMDGWTKAWAAKSSEMFDYYNPEAYSKATEDFNQFRQNKERLFKALDFIKIYNREIHALEGPGYWVTWAEQLYTASNLSTEGVRRLYWQKNDQGLFRIVGMEWIPSNLGMAAEYRQGKLVATAPVPVLSDASEVPTTPGLDMPEQAPIIQEEPKTPPSPAQMPTLPDTASKTSPALTETIKSLANKFLAASEPLIPAKQQRSGKLDEIDWGIGRKLSEPAQVITEPAEKIDPDPARPQIENTEEPKKSSPDSAAGQPRQEMAKLNDADKKLLLDQMEKWLLAMGNRDDKIIQLYDEANYNRLPISSGVPRTGSLNTLKQNIKRDFAQKGLQIFSRPPTLEPGADTIKTSQDIMLVFPASQRQGVQTLWWLKNEAGDYKIVGSRFQPMPLGLEAHYLETVSGDIAQMLEEWRKAWESADIDNYMRHYLPDASQPGRTGASVIRMQKSGLWSRIKPVMVQLSGLRLAVEPDGIRADMTQSYVDSAGRSDKGVKTLHLRHDGNQWRIKREDWATLSANKQE